MKTKLILLCASLSSCSPCPAGIVADTVFAEARGEGRRGMEAVCSVIWNIAGGNPEKLEAVCLKPKQFSCWNKGYAKAKPRNELERAILAFLEGIESQMESGEFKPTTGADHYYSPSKCSPKWAKELENVETIGRHVFGNCK